MAERQFDLFIIGGGVNGCGIARDAAGRGLSVGLAEMGDLGSATSSASTKLFHGGLRYLEHFEFRLVRESLRERALLLHAMPHISWPMRFVLPYHRDMRFDSQTPTARLLARLMPWMRGRRPAWLLRLGLFLYDSLGGRHGYLPRTRMLRLRGTSEGTPLQERFEKAFEYSDCWVDDARLVVLNARDAAARGATIMVRTKVMAARRDGDAWHIETQSMPPQSMPPSMPYSPRETLRARMLVNAAGPWAGQTLTGTLGLNSPARLRLVRGAHIVTRRLYDHEKCYFLQGRDGRIIFAIPYEGDFTLIGTTDSDHDDLTTPPQCTSAERDYLLDFANGYFRRQLRAQDVVWSYAGVRPLYDDGAPNASAATRDYVLTTDTHGPLLVNVFGGKITTYRKLAESVMDKIVQAQPGLAGGWTASVPLPGGDFAPKDVPARVQALQQAYPFLSARWAWRLLRSYGSEAGAVLGDARQVEDLGQCFGATLTAREVEWLITKEWARTAEDILWRRTKLGLRLDKGQVATLESWLAQRARSGA